MGSFDHVPEIAGVLGFMLAILVAPLAIAVWLVTLLLGSAIVGALIAGLNAIGFDTNPISNPWAWPVNILVLASLLLPVVAGAAAGLLFYRWVRDRVLRHTRRGS